MLHDYFSMEQCFDNLNVISQFCLTNSAQFTQFLHFHVGINFQKVLTDFLFILKCIIFTIEIKLNQIYGSKLITFTINNMTNSSKEAEFITQWNGILDYKIDEQNLRRPNFQFFYNALESLLRRLNFNIDSAKSDATINGEAERLYFIKFCGFVQKLYQLSDASFNFYYFDLINPSK